MALPRRLVVVGAGLLGGSLLAALQERRGRQRMQGNAAPLPARRLDSADSGIELVVVSGARTLEGLDARGWCDALHGYEDLETAVRGADLVLLSSPIAIIGEHLARISAVRGTLASGALVTDVGSTKSDVCRQGFEVFPSSPAGEARFVGGHPMAGSERSGIDASDPLLYQSAVWVVCPPPDLLRPSLATDGNDPLAPLLALIAAVGARSIVLDPATHDETVARISHLPQLLASALAAETGRDPVLVDACLTLAAGGFRDMTRLSLSKWEVWRDILATNAPRVAARLEEMSRTLSSLAVPLRAFGADPGDAGAEGALRGLFADGAALRSRFKAPRKGILHDVAEIVVRLEDRPGSLLRVLEPLAAAGLNVLDLEILKVREGESGTLLLAFATTDSATQAARLLSTSGFQAEAR